ncbi:MAG TPA: hypothetical protein VHQ03_10045 [Candidatus Dormibacteraeota bacterium]|nr:hypothetical protein [Candidatus Dormibacteraeota bacterium]
MAQGQMDQVSPPYEPAPAPYQYTRPSPLASLLRRLERRWFTVALAAGLLVSASGIGLLYMDDTNNQARINTLTLQNESLTGRAQSLTDQLTVTQHQLDVSRGQVSQLETELEHPTLGIWNTQETLHGPNQWLSSTVPDTFTYHLKLKSSAPMDVSILDTDQFRSAVVCMYDGLGSADYCLHRSGATWGALGVTSVNYDFPLAEGCAAYLAVISVPSGTVTITPDVTATYKPASTATGTCK